MHELPKENKNTMKAFNVLVRPRRVLFNTMFSVSLELTHIFFRLMHVRDTYIPVYTSETIFKVNM